MSRAQIILLLSMSLALLPSCDSVPWLEEAVRLPDTKTVVQVMIRAGGGYRTIVSNEAGSLSWDTVPIAEEHRHANLYLTPENLIVIIDAGGGQTFVEATPAHVPLQVSPTRMQVGDLWSSKWRYLGAIRRDNDRLRYISPKAEPECLPMLGEGKSPYRLRYQNMSSCPEH